MQPRLFDGYEVAAEYVKVPGITRKYALRTLLDPKIEPHHGDEVEVTIRYKMSLKPEAKFDGTGNLAGEVAEVWELVPLEDHIEVVAYVSRDELQAAWRQAHGATG